MRRPALLIFILISTFLISYIYLQEVFNLGKLKEHITFLKTWVSEEIYISRISFFTLYVTPTMYLALAKNTKRIDAVDIELKKELR